MRLHPSLCQRTSSCICWSTVQTGGTRCAGGRWVGRGPLCGNCCAASTWGRWTCWTPRTDSWRPCPWRGPCRTCWATPTTVSWRRASCWPRPPSGSVCCSAAPAMTWRCWDPRPSTPSHSSPSTRCPLRRLQRPGCTCWVTSASGGWTCCCRRIPGRCPTSSGRARSSASTSTSRCIGWRASGSGPSPARRRCWPTAGTSTRCRC
mmetsp:Transcript_4486/g.6737  ORF Transcript_4486/g.6737 Transcript_4486/m.6737 type:complete len:205 (-) Transcript_4486:59-673(-)